MILLAAKVRDAVGTDDIAVMWQTHFSELPISVHDTSTSPKTFFVNMLMLTLEFQ